MYCNIALKYQLLQKIVVCCSNNYFHPRDVSLSDAPAGKHFIKVKKNSNNFCFSNKVVN